MGSGCPGQNAENCAKSANGFKIEENHTNGNKLKHSRGVLGAQVKTQKTVQNQPMSLKSKEITQMVIKSSILEGFWARRPWIPLWTLGVDVFGVKNIHPPFQPHMAILSGIGTISDSRQE